MSFKYSFPKLYEFEKKFGNLIKGFIRTKDKKRNKENNRKGIFSFADGLNTLTDKIEQRLGDRVIKKASVTAISMNEKSFELEILKNGIKESIKAKRVVDTRSLGQTYSSFELGEKPFEPDYVPILSLHLGFRSDATGKVPHGFGLLTTKNSMRPYLGIIFSSSIFPHMAPKNHDLFTILIGGSRRPEVEKMKESDIVEKVINAFCEDMEISEKPVFRNTFYWHDAIPQYNLGHESVIRQVESFKKQYPGYFPAGNYHKGVSIGDRVKFAVELADIIRGQG
jgi:oxygen-dependent protoporphyrinogen oxidase